MDAFDLADKYRNPVMILGDGMTGQMMEPSYSGSPDPGATTRSTSSRGRRGQEQIRPCSHPRCPAHGGAQLEARSQVQSSSRTRSVSRRTRQATHPDHHRLWNRGADRQGGHQPPEDSGMKVGLIRPITSGPSPRRSSGTRPSGSTASSSFEMNTAMIDDVKAGLEGKGHVSFYEGRAAWCPRRRSWPRPLSRNIEGKPSHEKGFFPTQIPEEHPFPLLCGLRPQHHPPGDLRGHRRTGHPGNTIGVPPAGCAVVAYNYFDVDMLEAPHGRGCAVATGIKRTLPTNRLLLSG